MDVLCVRKIPEDWNSPLYALYKVYIEAQFAYSGKQLAVSSNE